MADNFVGWPVMVDDDGSLTVGTVPNKALFDAIRASFADNVYSPINPTVQTHTIIDEVIIARGNKANLNARLSVSMDADGVPIPAAGQATETQVRNQQAQKNLVVNGDMELWSAGTTSAPDSFALGGAGVAILKSGPGEPDGTDLGVGTYCARITSGGGAAGTLKQIVMGAASIAKWRSVKGKKVAAYIRVKATALNTVRLIVDDGVTVTTSPYNATINAEEDIAISHTVNAAATKIDIYAEVALGTLIAYVGGFTMSVSDLTGRWQVGDKAVKPTQALIGNATIPTTVNIGGRIHTNVTPVGNVGVGEDDLMSYAVPAGMLHTDLQMLRITCAGTIAASANTKQLKAHFGGTSITFRAAHAYGSAAGRWEATVYVIRTGAATQILLGEYSFSTTTPDTGVFHSRATPAETLANAITFKITGEATANDEVTQDLMVVEAVM